MRMLLRVRMLLQVIVSAAVAAVGTSQGAHAGLGQPTPWQVGLQDAASPVMENIVWFHDFLFWIITVITVFVLVLLVIVIVRFNANANPVPTRTTHNSTLEVLWTLIPVVILVVIAIPSFRMVYYQDRTPDPDLTIKVTAQAISRTVL